MVGTSQQSSPWGPAAQGAARWIAPALMLDRIALPAVLMDVDTVVQFANRAAREMFVFGRVVNLRGGRLHTDDVRQLASLQQAVRDAGHLPDGRTVRVGHGSSELLLQLGAVEPTVAAPDQAVSIMLLAGPAAMFPRSPARAFGRHHGLTPTEMSVLDLLCSGLTPSAVARRHGVEVSTVRTQIASIRHKTQSASAADLIRRVWLLPPWDDRALGAAS